jgi:hypothetical protein
MKRSRIETTGYDDFDILYAIWILASNDENPIMTYRSIKYRLGLPNAYDIKELVRKRAELFRRGIPVQRLKEWKDALLAGRHLPSWIRDIEDKSVQKATIESLTADDVFRSQFRPERDAPQSEIQIIDWGLQHIERLRKASAQAREERMKRWSNITIPVLSLLITLATVISSAYILIRNNEFQAGLKKYEVTFKTKQDGYGSFMRYVFASYQSAYKNDVDSLVDNLDKLESSYYVVEPFLDDSKRAAMWDTYQQFTFLCYRLREQPKDADEKRKEFFDSFLWYKKYFREQLYDALFKQ